jgi:hypothetical protein
MASSSARRSSYYDERHNHKSVSLNVGSTRRARFRTILRTIFIGTGVRQSVIYWRG